jgi:hypothetical protein
MHSNSTPTLHSTNAHTKVDLPLQEELAQYGILRAKVMDKAPPKKDGANFFGLRYTGGGESETLFDTSVKAIQDNDMMLAMAVPEDKTFNMLVTTDFVKAVSTASPTDLRGFLRRIFAEA